MRSMTERKEERKEKRRTELDEAATRCCNPPIDVAVLIQCNHTYPLSIVTWCDGNSDVSPLRY